jgi:hypothetical protein
MSSTHFSIAYFLVLATFFIFLAPFFFAIFVLLAGFTGLDSLEG